jgi:DNA-directed RNA polymerase subunit RPC12/RpoP
VVKVKVISTNPVKAYYGMSHNTLKKIENLKDSGFVQRDLIHLQLMVSPRQIRTFQCFGYDREINLADSAVKNTKRKKKTYGSYMQVQEVILMPLINCPRCSKKVSDRAISCPNCAFPVQQSAVRKNTSSYKPWTPVTQKPSISIWDSGTRCSKCGSTNVQVLANDLNTVQVKKGILGRKTVTKRKKSALRVGAAIVTSGLSLAVTGINKNNLEVFCRGCGHRWRTK